MEMAESRNGLYDFGKLFVSRNLQIHKLQAENVQIRQQTAPALPTAPPPSSERSEHSHVAAAAVGIHRRDRHAFSMYEPGASGLKPFGQQAGDDLVGRLQPFHPGVSVPGLALAKVHLVWAEEGVSKFQFDSWPL